MESLPSEMQMKVMLRLPFQDVVSMCNTNTEFKGLCDNMSFWNKKALRDYGIPLTILEYDTTPIKRYEYLSTVMNVSPYNLLRYDLRKYPRGERNVMEESFIHGRELDIEEYLNTYDSDIKNNFEFWNRLSMTYFDFPLDIIEEMRAGDITASDLFFEVKDGYENDPLTFIHEYIVPNGLVPAFNRFFEGVEVTDFITTYQELIDIAVDNIQPIMLKAILSYVDILSDFNTNEYSVLKDYLSDIYKEIYFYYEYDELLPIIEKITGKLDMAEEYSQHILDGDMEYILVGHEKGTLEYSVEMKLAKQSGIQEVIDYFTNNPSM